MSDIDKTPEAGSASDEGGRAEEVAGVNEDKGTQVPLSTLEKERKARQRLEKQIEELNKKQEEARLAELSEVDALKEQLKKTQEAATAAEKKRIESEHKSLVRLEANKVGFNDVSDAITFVDLSAFDGLEGKELEEAVSLEVERIKTEKPYLVADSTDKGGSPAIPKTDNGGADEPDGNDLGRFAQSLLFGKNR